MTRVIGELGFGETGIGEMGHNPLFCYGKCINYTIIIWVDRRSTDKRSKIDSGRSAQHVQYSIVSFFLSVCYAPQNLAPYSYQSVYKTYTQPAV